MSARHPEEPALALLSGGDLPWWKRVRWFRHVRACHECARKLEAYGRSRDLASEMAEDLPDGLDWDRLASEMTGNIRVGLAAGECVEPARPRVVSLGWKPAAAFATIAVLMAGGWWLNMPPESTQRLGSAIRRTFFHRAQEPSFIVDAGVQVGSGQDGVEVKQNGAVMTLMNPGSSCPSVVTASTQGVVRARYVDADTGQVTITNVYAQ